jgi:hypothetical protein
VSRLESAEEEKMDLDGTSVVVTGSFEGYGEGEVEAALVERGAKIVTMNPGVELVIAGAQPGLEYDEARELGIRVVGADGLQALLDGREPEPAVVDQRPPPEEPEPFEEPPPFVPPKSPEPEPDRANVEGEGGEQEFGKGARVKIIGGLEGVGAVGEIFWWGESKYGEGMRAGVSTDDDQTYWVDEEDLGWPDEEVAPEVLEAAEEAAQFGRGDEIRVKAGKHEGATGTIFWWGKSKWGEGMRAGVETDDGQKIWVDAEQLERGEDDESIPF